jgi:hypothetical protein
LLDQSRGLNAIHTRHRDVHQHEIRPQPQRQFHRLLSVAREPYDFEVRKLRKRLETAQAGSVDLGVRPQGIAAKYIATELALP